MCRRTFIPKAELSAAPATSVASSHGQSWRKPARPLVSASAIASEPPQPVLPSGFASPAESRCTCTGSSVKIAMSDSALASRRGRGTIRPVRIAVKGSMALFGFSPRRGLSAAHPSVGMQHRVAMELGEAAVKGLGAGFHLERDHAAAAIERSARRFLQGVWSKRHRLHRRCCLAASRIVTRRAHRGLENQIADSLALESGSLHFEGVGCGRQVRDQVDSLGVAVARVVSPVTGS